MQSELKFPTLSTQTAASNKKTTLVNKVSNMVSLINKQHQDNKVFCVWVVFMSCVASNFGLFAFPPCNDCNVWYTLTDQCPAKLATPCVSTWCYITSTCVTRFLSHTHKQNAHLCKWGDNWWLRASNTGDRNEFMSRKWWYVCLVLSSQGTQTNTENTVDYQMCTAGNGMSLDKEI